MTWVNNNKIISRLITFTNDKIYFELLKLHQILNHEKTINIKS